MHLCCQMSYSVSTIALWGIRMPAITTGVTHFCCQYLVGCLWERKPFLGGRAKKESYRILPQKFQDDLPVFPSWGLIGQPCSGRSEFFFFCIVFRDIRTVDCNSMLPDEGARLDQKGVGFSFLFKRSYLETEKIFTHFFSNLGWIKTNGQIAAHKTTLGCRKLVGFESQGMVLCATSKDGKVEPHG